MPSGANIMSAYDLIQTTTQLAHLSQLQELNSHFQAQQRAAAFQANLGQALFETERMARRVALTLPQDAFAASVLSYDWLSYIEGINAAHFIEVEHKRAWADAHETLTSAYRKGQFDPEVAPLLTPYFQNRARLHEILHWVEGDPNAFFAAAQHRYALATRGKEPATYAVKYAGIATGTLFLTSLVFGLANSPGGSSFFFLLGLIAAFYTFLKLISSASAKSSLRNARERYEADCRIIEAYSSFMRDPNAGGFLQKMWEKHPLLFNEPIPTGPTPHPVEPRRRDSHQGSSVQSFVERRIVERQIVVTRCRFCQQMTPVDLAACQGCGAPGFGG